MCPFITLPPPIQNDLAFLLFVPYLPSMPARTISCSCLWYTGGVSLVSLQLSGRFRQGGHATQMRLPFRPSNRSRCGNLLHFSLRLSKLPHCGVSKLNSNARKNVSAMNARSALLRIFSSPSRTGSDLMKPKSNH